MKELFAIRTWNGQLYGRFESHDDASAAIGRIRASVHRDEANGANVVPLLDGVTSMPLHPQFLSDAPAGEEPLEVPESLTRQEVLAAVDSLVSTYNDSRSARLGYRYVSASLLGSDTHLQEAVAALLAGHHFEIRELIAERDRFHGHSVTLNSVAFAMAEALGDVPPGADQVEGNPLEQVTRLVGTLERRTAQRDAARADVERAHQELRERGEEIQRLKAALDDARDRPWHADASRH